jgi:hypothetical protein
MPQAVFEPTVPVFQLYETVQELGHPSAVIDT